MKILARRVEYVLILYRRKILKYTAKVPNIGFYCSIDSKNGKDLKFKHMWQIADIHYDYINIQQGHFFGIEKIWLDENSQVLITDKERTLLDVFIYSKMFGGIGETLGILENSLAIIDIQKIINYAIQYDKKSLIKSLG